MRKHILTTAAVAAAIAGAFAGEPSFGTLTDNKDGQTYKTVKIGTQTWMAENINYQTKGGSWCYDNKADNCKKYGRLYDWMTAKTVCPKGWKLPDTADWNRLIVSVGGDKKAGKMLEAKSGWYGKKGNGTDDFGFSALPGGYRRNDGNFYGVGNGGGWWTATEYGSECAYYRNMDYLNDNVYEGYDNKSTGFSARCVKDSK